MFATSHLLGRSLLDIMSCLHFPMSPRIFLDVFACLLTVNIASRILSKLSKQDDRSLTMADISRFLRQVLVSQAQRPRTNKPFPSKHILCNELQQPFKQQPHKRSGHSLADTQRQLRSLHIGVLCNFFSTMAFTIRGMQTSVSCAVVLMHQH